jgi:hypothetical protein
MAVADQPVLVRPATGRFHNRRIVIRDGVRKDKPFSVRLYNATEIRDMLNRAELTDYELLDENSRPLSANSRRIVAIAAFFLA